MSWQDRVEAAQVKRSKSVNQVDPPLTLWPSNLPQSSLRLPHDFLTPREISLTEEFSATELLVKLRKREVQAEEVTRAFLRRAAIAHHGTNCLTELMWDEAIERAKYLDSLSEPAGPFHGLPISTKEIQGMRGKDKTCDSSYVSWIGLPSPTVLLHDILWDAGCVFYARTTQPQTVMHLETCSNIYGCTVNPYNRNHTCGGSSGGEGALVAMRGSLLGLGGDIGGSIRVPAAFNGVYGFKPTTSRFPGGNARMHMTGKDAILGACGQISTDRESIELLMRVVLDAKPWRQNPSIFPQPWTPYEISEPLKVAFMWSDNIVNPHPPVIRALREVSDACKAAGMEVIDWNPLDHDNGWEITSGLYFPDGGEEIMRILEESGEPVLPLTKFITVEQANVRSRSQKELWELCLQRDQFRTMYAQHWSKTGDIDGREVDVIVAPAYPGAAPPHECTRYWGYTSTWNLLDYPAAVFPVTHVSSEDDEDYTYVPQNAQDSFNHGLYNKERYLGLPINLQIIGRRNLDEKLFAALVKVEDALNSYRSTGGLF